MMRKLSGMFQDTPGYEGYVIGKAVYQSLWKNSVLPEQPKVSVKKRREGYAVLEAVRQDFCHQSVLQITLQKPVYTPGKGKTSKILLPGELPVMLWSVTADQIQTYLRDTGDYNPIHQGGNPVVPGLLIFEELWERLERRTAVSKTSGSAAMRFFEPVHQNDRVVIYPGKEEGQYDAYLIMTENYGRKVFSYKKKA